MTAKTNPAVDAFVQALDHPLKQDIIALRALVLGVNPAITEEIKWNAPSFRTSEHFATMQLRARDAVQLILHMGAKAGRAMQKADIADPEGLLKWLGPDRASISVRGSADFMAKSQALTIILRDWIRQV